MNKFLNIIDFTKTNNSIVSFNNIFISDKELENVKFITSQVENEVSKVEKINIDNLLLSKNKDFLLKTDEIIKSRLDNDLVERLNQQDMLKNSALSLLKFLFTQSRDTITPGFSYHYINGVSYFSSLAEYLVLEPGFDINIINDFNIDNLSSQITEIKELAIKRSNPIKPILSLENIISNDDKLCKMYNELAIYPSDPNIPDMPIDRNIIAAVAVLNYLGFETTHSCHGHELYDTVGIYGPQNPHILLDVSSDQLDYIRKSIMEFESEYKFPITFTRNIKSPNYNQYYLEAGDRVIVDLLSGADRANYIQWSLGVINYFVNFLYKKSNLK